MPELSVCVPVYRAERYIAACARSLFEQTIDDIEYIFVDDGSPDRSIARLLEVAAAYPRRLPPIRIIPHPANPASAAARTTRASSPSGRTMCLPSAAARCLMPARKAPSPFPLTCSKLPAIQTQTSLTLYFLPRMVYNRREPRRPLPAGVRPYAANRGKPKAIL